MEHLWGGAWLEEVAPWRKTERFYRQVPLPVYALPVCGCTAIGALAALPPCFHHGDHLYPLTLSPFLLLFVRYWWQR